MAQAEISLNVYSWNAIGDHFERQHRTKKSSERITFHLFIVYEFYTVEVEWHKSKESL